MANKRSPKKRRPVPKTVLRLPDFDQAEISGSEQLEFSRVSLQAVAPTWLIGRMVPSELAYLVASAFRAPPRISGMA